MKAHVFVNGIAKLPAQLKNERSFECTLIENPYNLKEVLKEFEGDKIVVVYLPFLEIRHFDIYAYLQKNNKNVKTFFIVNELSQSMKSKLKGHQDFIVLWKTEEHHLVRDIKAYLEGRSLELRQDKRENHESRTLLSPSLLPSGQSTREFQPILGGLFENISLNGSCIKIHVPFYNKKDFVNLSYQNKQGEYISVEGQVRWTKWDEELRVQEIGVQFLTQGSSS